MKKVLCPLGCAMLVAVLALAACGGSGGGASSSPSAAPSQGRASPSMAASPNETGTSLPTPTVAGTIAFTTLAGYNDNDICVVDTDGTGLKTLAGGEGCGLARWSPEERRSPTTRVRRGPGPSQIWVMNADGPARRGSHGGSLGYRNFMPSWSPDGKRIVFTSLVFYTDGVERDAIYVMNADGSGLRNVTSRKGPGVTSADYWPTWEEDGTITFYRNTCGGGSRSSASTPTGADSRGWSRRPARPSTGGWTGG